MVGLIFLFLNLVSSLFKSKSPLEAENAAVASEHSIRRVVRLLYDCFKSRRRLEAEIMALRHQLNVLQQRVRRGCIDYLIVFNAEHLGRIVAKCAVGAENLFWAKS
jgi:hypothetical protein